MKQGVLTNGRVRLLLAKGHSCYRPRRTGERKRKSVRGCIVDANLSVLALVVVKKGELRCVRLDFASMRVHPELLLQVCSSHRRAGDPRINRHNHPKATWSKESQQDQEAVQSDQGRRCPAVRREASASTERR